MAATCKDCTQKTVNDLQDKRLDTIELNMTEEMKIVSSLQTSVSEREKQNGITRQNEEKLEGKISKTEQSLEKKIDTKLNDFDKKLDKIDQKMWVFIVSIILCLVGILIK